MKKGLNPPSIQYLNFDSQYLAVTLKAGIISAILALAVRAPPNAMTGFDFVPFRSTENGHLVAILVNFICSQEGIAIGRSFAIMRNYQTDGNKEMIAFGLMNIVGSFTSCYLTTG